MIDNEVVCQLTHRQVHSVLNWYYSYPFTLSDRAIELAKFLGECIGEYDVVDED